ncbi:type I restriction-modification system subunit M N-terminal domain-containing protein, partial [Intestinimonas sp. HCP28S3_D6]|uniref:type I restriction-modification system subunit M N-terminal domain-containing protein n=1 Tax=Intestinimonas sp. HCP28S3_D6 TaxID=3438942 RepID=UPI003F8BF954
MAVKKTQLYASLWASCDKLRGGMDSSEYKDYILTLLFMKYVTDKFKNKGAYEDIKVFDKAHDKDPDPEKRTGCSFDDFIALKGKKNIGEGVFVKRKCEQKGPKKVSTFSTRFHVVSNVFPKYQMLT